MITEYHRPDSLAQAIALLGRTSPITIPLGGGTVLSRSTEFPVAVVDLQNLGLNKIENQQGICKIGAMTRLQDIVNNENLPDGLRKAARRETNINLRQAATIGGTLISSNGSSSLLGSLLALDVKIFWDAGEKNIYLGEWFAQDRVNKIGKLITRLEFNFPTNSKYDDIARSPEDKPQIFVTTAQWNTGEIRVVFGGCGKYPVLGSDGSKNMVSDIFNRFSYAAALERDGYSEYQQNAIKTLIDRLVPQTGIFGGKGLL